MRILNIQLTNPNPSKNWGSDKIIYQKGVFISFKSMIITFFITLIISLIYSEIIPTFPNINRYVLFVIVTIMMLALFAVGQYLYELLLKKTETNYTLDFNSKEIISNSKNIEEYLVEIHQKAKKNHNRILFNAKTREIEPTIKFLGDEEYNLLLTQKNFYIKYNSILLNNIKEIIKSKEENEGENYYDYFKKKHKLDDRAFIFLQRQLALRIKRLKQI